MKNEDIIGTKIGRWAVLENADDYISPGGQRQSRCLCECECGTRRVVGASSLRRGVSQSCGCLSRENASKSHLNDLTGMKFGKLKVVERSGTSKDHQAVWRCECECGGFVNVKAGSLRSGITSSCGCYRSSKGEDAIKSFLESHGYIYLFNVTLKTAGLICPDNLHKCRFDFVIKNNEHVLIVEYDGSQHFKNSMHNSKQEELFLRDDAKTQYCEEHNIPLLRIKYTQKNQLTDTLSAFLSNPDLYVKNHNPFLTNEQYYKDRAVVERDLPSIQFTTYDHLGNGFVTKSQMCKKYNIPCSMFDCRIKRGWSLKDALTKPRQYQMFDNSHINCEDHLGNNFRSISDMAAYWGLGRSTLQFRFDSGWDLKRALETPLRKQINNRGLKDAS